MPKHIEENKMIAVKKVTEELQHLGVWDRYVEDHSLGQAESLVARFCDTYADEVIRP